MTTSQGRTPEKNTLEPLSLTRVWMSSENPSQWHGSRDNKSSDNCCLKKVRESSYR